MTANGQARQACQERLPDGRHPRQCDARDVADDTLQMLDEILLRVALYIHPNGIVVRVWNPGPRLDDEHSASLVGVYDATASHADIVDDILALEAL